MLGGDGLVAVCDTTDCSPSIFGVNITILIFLFYFWMPSGPTRLRA